jgi:hypothetical protein
MITLKEWLEVTNHRITEGNEYYGFGVVAHSLTAWNGDQDGYSLELIFDPKTQVVFQVHACDYKHQRAYRLTNPDAPEERLMTEAWDGVNWVDLESDDDWIQKALAIVAGEDYDTRVSVLIDLTDEELFVLMKLAHKQDITLNQMVINILYQFLNKETSNVNQD